MIHGGSVTTGVSQLFTPVIDKYFEKSVLQAMVVRFEEDDFFLYSFHIARLKIS